MAQIGIDVSKQKLDVCWLRDIETLKVKTRVFPNSKAGHQALLEWLAAQTGDACPAITVVMGATGVYHEALAYTLYEAGVDVVVSNPYQVRQFAQSLGKRSKTDKKDSIVLARFLASREHQRWAPEPEAVRHLRALLSRLQALDNDIQRERNRQEKTEQQRSSAKVLESIEKMLTALEAERKRLAKDIDDHIGGHPELKADCDLLKSIPGIGPVLSVELMAALRSREFKSAGQAAAFFGLVPIMHTSGTSICARPKLSKAGGQKLRSKLYMGTIVAARHNPSVVKHYQRLLARGKARMSALCAAMRKLLQIAYGVLKHQTPYDPQWA